MEYKIETKYVEQAIALIDEEKKVAAIKLVREKSGAGLREAKGFVEYIVEKEPVSFDNVKIRGDVWNEYTVYTLSDLLDAWNKASEIHMDLKNRGLM